MAPSSGAIGRTRSGRSRVWVERNASDDKPMYTPRSNGRTRVWVERNASDDKPMYTPRGKGSGKRIGSTKGKGEGKSNRSQSEQCGLKDRSRYPPGYRWVPKTPRGGRKTSILTTMSLADISDVANGCGAFGDVGGRLEVLKTTSPLLDPMECLLIEPSGKRLGTKGCHTTGVVICIDGMLPTQESVEQWCQAVKSVGWLDVGFSVAIPNVQMSAALERRDMEAVVNAVCDAVDFNRCLLVGKGWGAQRVVELAADSRVADCVEGLLLVAPSGQASQMCTDVNVPVLVLWAQDDDISPIEDHETWLENLGDRDAPTSFQVLEEGGHNLARLVVADGLAEVLRHYGVSCLLMGNLAQEEHFEEQDLFESEDDEEQGASDSGVMDCKALNILRSELLILHLPPFLKQDATFASLREDGEAFVDAAEHSNCTNTERRIRKKLSMKLPQWIHSGMMTAAE
eukprot:TRINITY_DN63610_c0_g1_i1.p1 TRINITY_DN63610_c0_g1~~TRINITY_DN63610_c0_g1_i1.p1  ORF type:complete len:456 (+),score=100.84 TRINITY_DN63610_c0_g1_i1:91-1458(+)